MKIIIITLSLELGGSERRAITLARYFKRQGNDVELWGFSGPGSLSQICDEFHIPWKVFPFNWFQNPLNRLLNLYRFAKLLQKAKPDVLLPHTLIPNTACGIVWRWTGAKKCIGYEGGYEFGLAGYNWETLATKQMTWIICNAQHLADEMARYYLIDKQKIKIIPNGVELPEAIQSRAFWRAKLEVGEDTFLAVMVANLSSYKNHEALLRAWRLVLERLNTRDKNAKLLLAGKNFGTESSLKSLARELNIKDNVEFLGYVEDVAGLLNSVDLGVYSSEQEGCPNGVLECMLAGLAIAATDGVGIKEVVGEHQSPWLSPLGNDLALAENIISLMNDAEIRKRIGEKNNERVIKEYSSERMCETTERLLVG